jgi:hypothetical protein
MDAYQIMLEAILAVVFVLLVVVVVLRIVFPPIPPFIVEPEQREHIKRANQSKVNQ